MIAKSNERGKIAIKEGKHCLSTVLHSMPCETQHAFQNTLWLVDETLPGTPKGRSCVMTETPKPAFGPFSLSTVKKGTWGIPICQRALNNILRLFYTFYLEIVSAVLCTPLYTAVHVCMNLVRFSALPRWMDGGWYSGLKVWAMVSLEPLCISEVRRLSGPW